MPFEERVPANATRFWSEDARKLLGTTSEFAIDVDHEQYSKEVILKCNTIAMLKRIQDLQATIQGLRQRINALEETEELRQQEIGICCVCLSSVAVRILQNCGCRVLFATVMTATQGSRIRNCPYCRAARIRRDIISAPLHF